MRTGPRTFKLIVLLILSGSLGAQLMVEGLVIDAGGDPVGYANVALFRAGTDSLVVGAVSDTSGTYQLELAGGGAYRVVVSLLGYVEVVEEVIITGAVALGPHRLLASDYTLGEVTVTADRDIVTDQNGATVFNVGRSPFKTGYSGTELLRRAPGITTSATGALMMSNEAVIVRVNGRTLQLTGEELTNYLAGLNSEDVASIKIQRHLTADVRGETAGGVVDIILKNKARGLAGNSRTYYGLKRQKSYRIYSALNLNYGSDRWNIYGNFNYSARSELYDTDGTTDYFETGNSLLRRGNALLGRNRSSYRIGAVTNLGKRQEVGVEGFVTKPSSQRNNRSDLKLTNAGSELEAGINRFDDSIRNVTNHLLLNYSYRFDTLGSQLRLFADYSTQTVGDDNTSSSGYEYGLFTALRERNFSSSATDIKSLQLEWIQHFARGAQLTAGARQTTTFRDNALLSQTLSGTEWKANERTSEFTYDEAITAGFLFLRQPLGERTSLQLGLRVERTELVKTDQLDDSEISKEYYSWLPDAVFQWRVGSGRSWSLGYSRRLRRPPFWRINNNVLKTSDFNYILGNPDLLPESVSRAEASWTAKKQKVRLYHEIVGEAINGVYTLEGEVAFYQPFNNGKQVQYGGEFNHFGHLSSRWYLNATLGVYHRKFVDGEGGVSFDRTSFYGNLSNTINLSERVSVDVSAYYYSPYEDAAYVEKERFSADVFLQLLARKKQLTLRLYARDVFNTLVYRSERPFPNFLITNGVKPQTQFLQFQIDYRFSGRANFKKRQNESRNDARERM